MLYDEIALPVSLDTLIVALCGEYFRMRDAAREGELSYRTVMEYRYYSFKIYDAAAEIVGEREAESYIGEIGSRLGYARSSVDGVSEVTYKQRKRRVKINIARRLHLLD